MPLLLLVEQEEENDDNDDDEMRSKTNERRLNECKLRTIQRKQIEYILHSNHKRLQLLYISIGILNK